jgi:hypothetical protein
VTIINLAAANVDSDHQEEDWQGCHDNHIIPVSKGEEGRVTSSSLFSKNEAIQLNRVAGER